MEKLTFGQRLFQYLKRVSNFGENKSPEDTHTVKANVKNPSFNQVEEIRNSRHIIDKLDEEKMLIERNGDVKKLPINQIKPGDFLLLSEGEIRNLDSYQKDLTNLLNLRIEHSPNEVYVRYGEVDNIHLGQIGLIHTSVDVNYRNLLADLKADVDLVKKETEPWHLKEMHWESEIYKGDNKILNSVLEKNGPLDKLINSTLTSRGIEPNESYKINNIVQADNYGNNILFLENKNGDINSYNVGALINIEKLEKGNQINLKEVLRNSVALIEKAVDEKFIKPFPKKEQIDYTLMKTKEIPKVKAQSKAVGKRKFEMER